jgi:hypothetical protein
VVFCQDFTNVKEKRQENSRSSKPRGVFAPLNRAVASWSGLVHQRFGFLASHQIRFQTQSGSKLPHSPDASATILIQKDREHRQAGAFEFRETPGAEA